MVVSLSDKIKFYESIFGRGRISGNGKNFDVRCPICSPKDLTKKKLAIRTTDDANHCWTCGWKARSLVPLLRKYGTQEHLNAYKQLTGKGSNLVTAEVEAIKKVELPKDSLSKALDNDMSDDIPF